MPWDVEWTTVEPLMLLGPKDNTIKLIDIISACIIKTLSCYDSLFSILLNSNLFQVQAIKKIEEQENISFYPS